MTIQEGPAILRETADAIENGINGGVKFDSAVWIASTQAGDCFACAAGMLALARGVVDPGGWKAHDSLPEELRLQAQTARDLEHAEQADNLEDVAEIASLVDCWRLGDWEFFASGPGILDTVARAADDEAVDGSKLSECSAEVIARRFRAVADAVERSM